jgi:hypothetical protein
MHRLPSPIKRDNCRIRPAPESSNGAGIV